MNNDDYADCYGDAIVRYSRDLEPFYRAIQASPHDMTPHMVMADYLDEHHPNAAPIAEQIRLHASGAKENRWWDWLNNGHPDSIINGVDNVNVGRAGPFHLHLSMEGGPGQSPRYVVHVTPQQAIDFQHAYGTYSRRYPKYYFEFDHDGIDQFAKALGDDHTIHDWITGSEADWDNLYERIQRQQTEMYRNADHDSERRR